MGPDTPPRGRAHDSLRYATDLTADDVTALETFVKRHLDATNIPIGTPEHRPVVAARLALRRIATDTRVAMQRPRTEDAYRVLDNWNLLLSIAAPWSEEPGYDGVRWVSVQYATPGAERLDAEIRARVAEKRAGR